MEQASNKGGFAGSEGAPTNQTNRAESLSSKEDTLYTPCTLPIMVTWCYADGKNDTVSGWCLKSYKWTGGCPLPLWFQGVHMSMNWFKGETWNIFRRNPRFHTKKIRQLWHKQMLPCQCPWIQHVLLHRWLPCIWNDHTLTSLGTSTCDRLSFGRQSPPSL